MLSRAVRISLVSALALASVAEATNHLVQLDEVLAGANETRRFSSSKSRCAASARTCGARKAVRPRAEHASSSATRPTPRDVPARGRGMIELFDRLNPDLKLQLDPGNTDAPAKSRICVLASCLTTSRGDKLMPPRGFWRWRHD